jgi:hypothetical protein
MLELTIRGSVGVAFTLTLVVGIATGCSTTSSSMPANSGTAASTALAERDEEPMRPAAGTVASAPSRGKISSKPGTIEQPFATAVDDLPSAPRAEVETPLQAREAGCAMHAESTPRGIALVFSAESSPPERVTAQVTALGAELELHRREIAEAGQVEPSSFGTRQIAELTAQTIVTQTPDGARLTIDAKDPERVDALRARVLWHMAAFLPDSRDTRGVCPVVPRISAEQREREAETRSSEPDQRRVR